MLWSASGDAIAAMAALAADYSARSANAIARQLLANPKVRDAIQVEMRATAIATKELRALAGPEPPPGDHSAKGQS